MVRKNAGSEVGFWRGGNLSIPTPGAVSGTSTFFNAKQQTWEHRNQLRNHYNKLATIKSTIPSVSRIPGPRHKRKDVRLPPIETKRQAGRGFQERRAEPDLVRKSVDVYALRRRLHAKHSAEILSLEEKERKERISKQQWKERRDRLAAKAFQRLEEQQNHQNQEPSPHPCDKTLQEKKKRKKKRKKGSKEGTDKISPTVQTENKAFQAQVAASSKKAIQAVSPLETPKNPVVSPLRLKKLNIPVGKSSGLASEELLQGFEDFTSRTGSGKGKSELMSCSNSPDNDSESSIISSSSQHLQELDKDTMKEVFDTEGLVESTLQNLQLDMRNVFDASMLIESTLQKLEQ